MASPASINSLLYPNQTIKTGTKSTAEILWSNGTKTNVEANSSYNVTDLYNQSSGQVLAQSESVFWFQKVFFIAAKESKLAEEGGIRRAKAKTDTMTPANQVYWKKIKNDFRRSIGLLWKRDYVKAAWAFKTFLDQKCLLNEMAKYATLLWGILTLNSITRSKPVRYLNRLSINTVMMNFVLRQKSVLAKFHRPIEEKRKKFFFLVGSLISIALTWLATWISEKNGQSTNTKIRECFVW